MLIGLGAVNAQAPTKLPTCYSIELDNCLFTDDQSYPNCEALRQYDKTEEGDAFFDKLPPCAEPRTPWATLVGASVSALVLGFFVGRMR